MTALANFFSGIFSQIISMSFFDVLDIAIVSIIFYYVYKFAKERRAGTLAAGILVIVLIAFLSNIFNMQVLSFITANIVQVGLIGLIILFQSELRSALEKMGGSSFRSINLRRDNSYVQDTIKCIDEVVEGAMYFSREKVGSLIVFERTTKLGDVIRTGTIIDAAADSFLLKNIFYDKAPLHDGALIIKNSRFYSAGCFLPLSLNNDIIKDLGTRHRAAIGISENSDAVVIVVSEETGTVSLVVDGHIKRNYDETSLRTELISLLISGTKDLNELSSSKEKNKK